MTLKLRLPTSRFRRRGGGDRGRHQSPNASDESKTSTKTSSLSSGASSSCSSTSYQPRPPLPVIIASNVRPSTSNATDTPPTSTIHPPVASLPPQQPPAALPHLPNLVNTSTIIAHGTQPLALSARRTSWRSTSLGSMRSINEDAELPSDSDDDLGLWGKNVKQNVTDGNAESEMSPASRHPLLSYRASSNSSLTSVSSCPCPAATSSSSLISKREVREEKIRRKNFEARRKEFETGNPRRLSDDGRSTSSGEEDPRLIRRRRQSVDFLREESQAAAMNGDADDDCCYCHHGERCLDKYRPRSSRSSSLDDSSDQRVHAEHASTGYRRRATMPSYATSANQTLIDSYYGEQARPFSHVEDDCSRTSNDSSSSSGSGGIPRQQSSTTTTATCTSNIRRSSMPISIIEDESDEECTAGNSPSNTGSNANGSRDGGYIGLLEDLEGRGLLKVQNAGLAGALLYYDTENRRLSL